MPTASTEPEPRATRAQQVLSELDVAALAARILDAHRAHVVVVVTAGNRALSRRIDADLIAAALGPSVEVATIPTGSLTYALERGLPGDTHVFGDAARTYPVGTAWHTRPHLSTLRSCRADTDARLLAAQVIADARAAARLADRATPVPPARIPGPGVRPTASRPTITPAMLPRAPRRPAPAPAPAPASAPAPAPVPGPPVPAPAPPVDSPPAPTTTRGPSGPTPTNPHGAPARPAASSVPPTRPRGGAPARARRPSGPRGRLAGGGPWHALTDADGRALAGHLIATREYPVLVVTTPREGAQPLVDAADLHQRVGAIADVVVLHNGPASWALAEAMPPLTQVYGGAGRVYPIDAGWQVNPYRAPIRFCWPGDDPAMVADRLEDDAYAAANLDGLTAAQTTTATLQVTGTVKGPLDRHHVAVRLDRGGDAVLLVDQIHPGIEPERLLRTGQVLAGRIQSGRMFPAFLPDPLVDDPAARAASTYRVGDVVLARVLELAARRGRALLHPQVGVTIVAAEDEVDLRNLLTEGDVATVTLLGCEDGFTAELSDVDAPSVACLPVIPGGPPWLTEDDLPLPAPEPLPAQPVPAPQPPRVSPPAPQPVPGPVVAGPAPTTPAVGPTPSAVGQQAQIAALTAQVADLAAQVNSLTGLLGRERERADKQELAARRARKEAQDAGRKLKSAQARHEAYRERMEGTALFSDPEAQLRYDIAQTWLRRTSEPERPSHPLAAYRIGPDFLPTLTDLEGVSREKILDVLVEVLTDRAKDIPGRELHPLRESATSQVQRVRGDGARAWRCALQVGTASARRLHFWRLPDGSIELDRVGTHDDRA